MSGDCDFGLIGLAVMGENLALNVRAEVTKSRFIIERPIRSTS